MKPWMLLAAAAFASPAMADTHISYVSNTGQPGVQMYVREGKVRVESPADHRIALYDMSTHTLTVMLPDQKRYLQFDGLAAWNAYVATHTRTDAGIERPGSGQHRHGPGETHPGPSGAVAAAGHGPVYGQSRRRHGRQRRHRFRGSSHGPGEHGQPTSADRHG